MVDELFLTLNLIIFYFLIYQFDIQIYFCTSFIKHRERETKVIQKLEIAFSKDFTRDFLLG
jgi:hypothetical protein